MSLNIADGRNQAAGSALTELLRVPQGIRNEPAHIQHTQPNVPLFYPQNVTENVNNVPFNSGTLPKLENTFLHQQAPHMSTTTQVPQFNVIQHSSSEQPLILNSPIHPVQRHTPAAPALLNSVRQGTNYHRTAFGAVPEESVGNAYSHASPPVVEDSAFAQSHNTNQSGPVREALARDDAAALPNTLLPQQQHQQQPQQLMQPDVFAGAPRRITGYVPSSLGVVGDSRQARSSLPITVLPSVSHSLTNGSLEPFEQSAPQRFESSLLNPSRQQFDNSSLLPDLNLRPPLNQVHVGNHVSEPSSRLPDSLSMNPPLGLGQPTHISTQQPARVTNFVEPAPDSLGHFNDVRQNAPSLPVVNQVPLAPILQPSIVNLSHPNGFNVQAQPFALPTGSVPVANTIGYQQPVAAVMQPSASTPEQLFDNQMAVGYAYRNIGQHDLAAESFRTAACLRPGASEARSCYALACHEQGMFEVAVTEFNVALSLGAAFPDDVYNNLGNTYRSMGRSHDAEMAYRTALQLSPRHAHAWNNLGNAMRGQGKLEEAMQCYSSSLSAMPGFAPAHCNLAGLLRDQGKPHEAEAQYRAAFASDPNLAEAAAGLGTALRDMGRAEEAIDFYIRAVTLQPSGADHHANLANTYKDLNRIEESIGSYQAALDLQPDMPDAFCNMVHSLSVICDWRNRKEHFKILLSIVDKQLDALLRHPSTHPQLVTALYGALTNSTPKQVNANGGSRSERESSVLSRSEENKVRRMRHPSSPMSSRSGTSSRNGDSQSVVPRRSGYVASAKKVSFSAAFNAIVSPVIATGLPSVQPFHALIYPMTPEKFKALAAAYASRAQLMVQGIAPASQLWVSPSRNGGRLKLGYVSSDYNNHPYSHLTQSIYGLHRGSNVECFCYALTPSDGSAWRHRIETEVENFRDISSFNAQQSAQAIANDGIHVLVNCNGYTKGARTELFALRPAPVQVSFMGFAGTLGAHYIEYFLTDTMTSPPHLSSRMHSEALLYHPHTYFVNDHKQTSIEGPRNYPGGPLTRARYGLPENCFLFIMHNQVYKIDPATFDVWARILKRVPNSKLWLLRFPPSAESRIREEARLRGLAPDRIIFTDVASKEEHVARCGLGDLFLDTPTCNAHTTGTDALWSGIPLITCPGSLFASRVAASLLNAAGLSELICYDMKHYEELAVELATNPQRLASIRHRLESSRQTNPLFDTRRWVRNVEALYWQAWRRFESRQQPAHIYGQDVYEANRMLMGSSSSSTGMGMGIVQNGFVPQNGVGSLIRS